MIYFASLRLSENPFNIFHARYFPSFKNLCKTEIPPTQTPVQ